MRCWTGWSGPLPRITTPRRSGDPAALDEGRAWNPHAGKSSRRRSTNGSGVVWTSSARVCPTTIPYRAWANFEFQTADGAIYEVDLLVLTKQGFWLVECKAWEGRIYGRRRHLDPLARTARLASEDNPVLLANRKAKALLVAAQGPVCRQTRSGCRGSMPWSSCRPTTSSATSTGPARNRVCFKDRPAERRSARTQGHPRRPHES